MGNWTYLERRRVIAAVPHAGAAWDAIPALVRLDPVAVAHVAADASVPWWRRRPCALSLEGRVPDALAAVLWERIEDDGDVTEVRVALLSVVVPWCAAGGSPAATALAERAQSWLRARSLDALPYGMDHAVILARCHLGDLEVADALAQLVHDPWSHRARAAEEATAALIASRGRAAVLGAFGVDDLEGLVIAGPTAQARHFGVRLWEKTEPAPKPASLLVALHDEDIVVAEVAARALLSSDVSDELLLACFDDNLDALWAEASAPPPLTGRAGAACWALITVARRRFPSGFVTEPVTVARAPEVHARLEPLAELGVPLAGIPREVREAILRAHLPGQRTTDPRLVLEGLRLGRCEHDVEPQHAVRAYAALAAAGLRVGEPRPIGEVMAQGGGSYEVLQLDGSTIDVCTFGPFARCEGPVLPHVVSLLEDAELRFIDAELSARMFEGLAVYYFGRREPLTVGELLFYWQD